MLNLINFILSHAGVYTREEIIRIFRTKLNRLKFLYKQQLLILNDKLLIDRKKHLLTKQNSTNSTASKINYKTNILVNINFNSIYFKIQANFINFKKKSYLNKRYNPLFKESTKSILCPKQPYCSFLIPDSNETTKTVKCNKNTIPLSDYCKERNKQYSFF